MPARVVLVFKEPGFSEKAARLLNDAGYDTAPMTDPFAALDALESARKIELLVTCADYGPNKPNGLALVRMARLKRSSIRAIFVGTEDTADHADGVASFLRSPATVDEVVEAVMAMMKSSGT